MANFLTAARAFFTSTLGMVVVGAAVLIGLLSWGLTLLIASIVGLPTGLSMLIAFLTFVALVATGTCIALKRFGAWKSGGTVGSVIFMIWLLFFIFWEGTRVYMYATDLYQWSWAAKFGMYAVGWTGLAAALGIWITLVYKGPKVVIWAFALGSVLVTLFAGVDAAQINSPLRSPFSGEVMVKVGVDSDGTQYAVPKGASHDRRRPWVTEFRELNLNDENDRLLLREWYRLGIGAGVSDEEIAAHYFRAAQKAAAKTAGLPEPECSVTGAPELGIPTVGFEQPSQGGGSDLLWLVLFLGIPGLLGMLWGSDASDRVAYGFFGMVLGAGLSLLWGIGVSRDPAHYWRPESALPAALDLPPGQEIRLNLDLQRLSVDHGPVTAVICDGHPTQLFVENGGVGWVQQYGGFSDREPTPLAVGRPFGLKFVKSGGSGNRVVTFKNGGENRMFAVVGFGHKIGRSCPTNSTGFLVAAGIPEKAPAAP